ncbi:unnamed protein product [Closterium sp. Naga37s-1]|nr:unnamed protein product [Closterium sp. Naga37s-1]
MREAGKCPIVRIADLYRLLLTHLDAVVADIKAFDRRQSLRRDYKAMRRQVCAFVEETASGQRYNGTYMPLVMPSTGVATAGAAETGQEAPPLADEADAHAGSPDEQPTQHIQGNTLDIGGSKAPSQLEGGEAMMGGSRTSTQVVGGETTLEEGLRREGGADKEMEGKGRGKSKSKDASEEGEKKRERRRLEKKLEEERTSTEQLRADFTRSVTQLGEEREKYAKVLQDAREILDKVDGVSKSAVTAVERSGELQATFAKGVETLVTAHAEAAVKAEGLRVKTEETLTSVKVAVATVGEKLETAAKGAIDGIIPHVNTSVTSAVTAASERLQEAFEKSLEKTVAACVERVVAKSLETIGASIVTAVDDRVRKAVTDATKGLKEEVISEVKEATQKAFGEAGFAALPGVFAAVSGLARHDAGGGAGAKHPRGDDGSAARGGVAREPVEVARQKKAKGVAEGAGVEGARGQDVGGSLPLQGVRAPDAGPNFVAQPSAGGGIVLGLPTKSQVSPGGVAQTQPVGPVMPGADVGGLPTPVQRVAEGAGVEGALGPDVGCSLPSQGVFAPGAGQIHGAQPSSGGGFVLGRPTTAQISPGGVAQTQRVGSVMAGADGGGLATRTQSVADGAGVEVARGPGAGRSLPSQGVHAPGAGQIHGANPSTPAYDFVTEIRRAMGQVAEEDPQESLGGIRAGFAGLHILQRPDEHDVQSRPERVVPAAQHGAIPDGGLLRLPADLVNVHVKDPEGYGEEFEEAAREGNFAEAEEAENDPSGAGDGAPAEGEADEEGRHRKGNGIRPERGGPGWTGDIVHGGRSRYVGYSLQHEDVMFNVSVAMMVLDGHVSKVLWENPNDPEAPARHPEWPAEWAVAKKLPKGLWTAMWARGCCSDTGRLRTFFGNVSANENRGLDFQAAVCEAIGDVTASLEAPAGLPSIAYAVCIASTFAAAWYVASETAPQFAEASRTAMAVGKQIDLQRAWPLLPDNLENVISAVMHVVSRSEGGSVAPEHANAWVDTVMSQALQVVNKQGDPWSQWIAVEMIYTLAYWCDSPDGRSSLAAVGMVAPVTDSMKSITKYRMKRTYKTGRWMVPGAKAVTKTRARGGRGGMQRGGSGKR